MTIQRFPRDEHRVLDQVGTWPRSVHLLDSRTADALEAAMAARRPLLVSGEPGTGKSQLARAAAAILERPFIAEVIHADSERQDLLYHFDVVARLGEAQIHRAACDNSLAAIHFLAPGPLWWTLNWKSAMVQHGNCTKGMNGPVPPHPKDWKQGQGCVLLIDEIDKADGDLPNSLLEALGNSSFSVPYGIGEITQEADAEPPLVVITTNEERELPAAFIRRCLVLHLELPAGREEKEWELLEWLVHRGELHFGDTRPGARQGPCYHAVLLKAARQLREDRLHASEAGISPPGQAEYLDILRAVGELADTEAGQMEALMRIKDFSLKKFSHRADG